MSSIPARGCGRSTQGRGKPEIRRNRKGRLKKRDAKRQWKGVEWGGG